MGNKRNHILVEKENFAYVEGMMFDYKVDSFDMQQKLINLVRNFGQLLPVITYKHKIVAFSKIYFACKQLRHDTVMILKLDEQLTEEEVIIISLAINEMNLETDYIKVAFMLSEKFKNVDSIISLLPFNKNDIEKLNHIKKFDWQAFCRAGDSHPELFEPEVSDKPASQSEQIQEYKGSYCVSFSYEIVRKDMWDKPCRFEGTQEQCTEYVKSNKPEQKQSELF